MSSVKRHFVAVGDKALCKLLKNVVSGNPEEIHEAEWEAEYLIWLRRLRGVSKNSLSADVDLVCTAWNETIRVRGLWNRRVSSADCDGWYLGVGLL